ncbi:MAG TPA: ABC transporter permease [Alloacidobacterium sp.]|nr:ABC transporter permease [Alloacidobacterium sp.]
MAFFEDLRFALRQLVKAPGFALTAIVTLALGIGANTAIFSVIHAVLMHPSGVDAPERVGIMHTKYANLGLDFADVSVPDFADALALKDQVQSAAIEQSDSYNILHDGRTEHLDGSKVTWQWFNVFGARPILGRTFIAEEDQKGANSVAVLSYSAWQKFFGGDRNVVGRTVMLNQMPYRVIGVMRSDFDWPRGKEVWTPMGLEPKAYDLGNRFNESYTAAVRLQPGVSFAQLTAGLAAKSHEEYVREGGKGFAAPSKWGMAAVPLTEFAAGPLRKPLYVLFGVVGLVLLIASANVAGLFLARASSRTKEFAIRTALGANAWRLVRQMLTETALLAGLATMVGIALGPAFGRMLLWMVPQSLAEGYTVEMSFGVLAFTAAAGLLTSLIAGIGPAVKMVRGQKRLELHEGRSSTASVDKQRLRSTFVIGEVAMAFVLLAGTGLFLASLKQMQQINPGFNPHGVLTGMVVYSGEGYKDNREQQQAFVNAVLDNLKAQPGVKSAAATTSMPFSNQDSASSFEIEGRPLAPNDPGPHSQLSYATPDYLRTMQIPLLAGRWISPEDRSNTQSVVVIDQKLAKKCWPGQNPIGQHLRDGRRSAWTEVVGVVADVRPDSLEEDVSDGMRYYPFSQSARGLASFAVRTDGEPLALAPALNRAIAAADPAQTAFDVSSLESRVDASLASRRLIVWLLTAFAGLALVLALVGIYGLISYVTEQRTNEIGIRMALGAQRGQVVGLIMKSALAWVGIGLAIGICMSFFAESMLKQVFTSFGGGVFPSLAVAMAALLAIGGLAGLIPAQRAASIDPAKTLRSE